jgi:hypothetical protein
VVTRPLTYCGCGCGAPVTRRYKPGHDARHKSALVSALSTGDALARAASADLLVHLGWGTWADPAALRAIPWRDRSRRAIPHVESVARWQVDHLGVHHAHRTCPNLTRAARMVQGINPTTRLASDRYVTLVDAGPNLTTHLMSGRSWDQCLSCSTTEHRDEYVQRMEVGKVATLPAQEPDLAKAPLTWDIEMDDDTERLIHVTKNPITHRVTRTWPDQGWAPPTQENAA